MAISFKEKQEPVVATKAKPAAKTKAKAELTVAGKLADEMYALDKQIAPVRPLIKEYDAKRKELAAFCVEHDPKHPCWYQGDEGRVEFSACKNLREVKDMHGLIGALKAKIGYKALLQLLQINTGDVEKYLSASEMAPFYKDDFGSRNLLKVGEANNNENL